MPTYINGFEIDAILSEDDSSECDITDHPVEKGVSITDHARLKPKVITLTCLVSDTPVGALAERRAFATEEPGATGLSSGPNGDFAASEVARNWLKQLQTDHTLVMVSSEWDRGNGKRGYKAYDNMMIQSVSEKTDADTGDSATFQVTLKQIIFVTNDRTIVQVATPRAKKKVDKGNKPNTEPKTPPRRKSWAIQLGGAASDFGGGVAKDLKGLF